MKKLLSIILNWPKTILVIVLLCSIPFIYAFFNKTYLNHVGRYFEEDDPKLVAYRNFQKTYGNEELSVIIVHSDHIFSNQGLNTIRAISNLAKKTPGIQRVFSLTEATDAVGKDDSISFEPVIPKGELSEQELQELKQRVLDHEILSSTLISSDAKTTAITIELEPLSSNEIKGEVLESIKTRTEHLADEDFQLYFAGVPYVEHEITGLTQKDDRKLTPITIAAIFLMSILFFRMISLSLLCLLNIFLTLAWSVGVFVLSGQSFMMVTVVMPPILLAIAVADSIHIISHFRTKRRRHRQSLLSTVSETINNLWLPCFFTSLTTGIGFLSFTTATIGPVRTLGIYTFIGVMIAFGMTIIVLPTALLIFRKAYDKRLTQSPDNPALDNQQDIVSRIIAVIANYTVNHYKLTTAIFIVITAVALTGAYRVTYETNFVNHLSKSNRLRKDMEFIENHFFGTVPVVLLIRAKSPQNDFTHPESLQLLDQIQGKLKKDFQGEYTSFFSITDYFKSINRAFNGGGETFFKIPENASDILDYYELGEGDTINRIVSPDRMEARISFNAYVGPIKKNDDLKRYLKENIIAMLGDNFTYQHTGLGALYVAMDRNLRTSQVRSFSVASVIIFFMMLMVCRSLKLTFISMLPNLFPIVCTFGLMGFFGIPLDVSTIMIASVTIGIAVDDTIHFIVWYRRNIDSGLKIESALLKTYQDTGKPILITSIILSVSFFIFVSGSVQPVKAFGLLAGLSMLFALIGDFFILPAMILIFRPELKKKHGKPADRRRTEEQNYSTVSETPSPGLEAKEEW